MARGTSHDATADRPDAPRGQRAQISAMSDAAESALIAMPFGSGFERITS
jgi:hypothetical protein